MTIYDRIKQLRIEKRMSQDELAAKVGYQGRSAISKVESGARDISQSMIKKYADALGVSPEYLLYGEGTPSTVRIPVYGRVAAGIPMEAITDISDYEEIDAAMAANGEYIALTIHGHSMEPRFTEGDVVIVRKQPEIEDGQIAVVMINGDDATVKRIHKTRDGLVLLPTNPAYEPIYYTNKQIRELPVKILGKVVELRAKF
ncbi:MAG: helix-turn-helix domain-containing protein [Clostridia bacterium]|nr:helix-turn-helix domain-containing protein [Clostridia bacterium]MBQ3871003.1 helix-turn-helix domain-containing protein [Clostridia bacterium]